MSHPQAWQGQPAYAPAPRNGFGITALVLALVGAVFGLIPFTGFIALILGALAVLFGLLGLGRVRKGVANNRKMTIIGTVLGALVAALGIWGIVIVFNAFGQLNSDLQELAPAPTVQPSGVGVGQEPAGGTNPAFPGAGPDDVAASYGQTVVVGPLDITAAAPVTVNPQFGDELVCSTVTYRNVGNGTGSYNPYDWSVLGPNGTITSSTFSGIDSQLGSGEIVPGASVSGDVCFNGSLDDGAFTVIYSPTFGGKAAFSG
ncbi:DUF4190 and DUF4352 domain-containing protein [Pseudonocardia sp. KRD-184]|uniref:DUF4190 and DUF4352 domain-containing protein n=1 Tax=Pseudonocardia oceani TaxID=2792013 RepID=A0ABS6U8M7_9PSEU|nr:DUF4352 domain-containing protein [Pseudonocardia oceani]MBW0089338.1 DUF4190 and DUF4352 domain-containing protein [Pseudonocardia oceani]MBW0095953.1 DUF4190 and DUF4352 domain-containing protein [Pseudonocardia oceani]MBW0108634.1 DUF4190 and DUF4352 domain-containing protein [Pseudonocardia oceani]MBW0122762.1 DUF4190 and DUF4352 domain-containing protein [Pseudonocardia oceani]MBW0128604.1 DUF4190 and DUF4352 domain-containing protein [Pseudonocardia oceani]